MAPQTLLIIDDEPSILESLSMFFQDEGYHVLTAENGKKGLEAYFANAVDLIITDLRMPVQDGNEVMRAVTAHALENQLPPPPMIVISGVGEKKDIINALRLGAKDYITKPFDNLDMIGHTIGKALENKRLEEQNRRYRQEIERREAQYRTITHQIAEGVFTLDV
ncbi:MAG: response regulator, partial [Desulfobacterales bacterium]|nr:response regulator [Desulfobacterales bacterium]